jgi:parallel beta-helix repeat protein
MHISLTRRDRSSRSPYASLPPQAAAATRIHSRSRIAVIVAAVAGLVAAGLPGTASAAVRPLANACDVTVVPIGQGGVPGTLEAAPGDTVQLTANSVCDPVIGPVFNPRTGTTEPGLVSGDGIAIEAPGVKLDLNGFGMSSSRDIAAEAAAQGADVENAGVIVGAQNVTVTNSSTTAASRVVNFTANFDFGKGGDFSTLRGAKLADGSYNLVGGDAHGGGVLAIDRTQRITLDTVALVDLAAEPPAAATVAGDNGIDWKRCTGPTGTITNSLVVGPLTGLRMRGCTSGGFSATGTTFQSPVTLQSPGGPGIEFTRDVKGASLTGNTISGNAADGVAVRTANENISITNNTIQNNGGCGILTAATAKNITTAPNAFLNNAGGDVCTK